MKHKITPSIIVFILAFLAMPCACRAEAAADLNRILDKLIDDPNMAYSVQYYRVGDDVESPIQIDKEGVGMLYSYECKIRYSYGWNRWTELMSHMRQIRERSDRHSCDFRYAVIITNPDGSVVLSLYIAGLTDEGMLDDIPVTVDGDFRKWLDEAFPINPKVGK